MKHSSGPRNAKTDAATPQAMAAELAIRALTYLAAESQRLSRFLALTGIDPTALRAAAANPDFLAGILEYLCGEEALLIEFAAEAAVTPAEVERARAALGGGRWERDIA